MRKTIFTVLFLLASGAALARAPVVVNGADGEQYLVMVSNGATGQNQLLPGYQPGGVGLPTRIIDSEQGARVQEALERAKLVDKLQLLELRLEAITDRVKSTKYNLLKEAGVTF